MKFLTPEEARDWIKITASIENLEFLSEKQKADLKTALIFLKSELGNDFLKELDINHPVFFNVVNRVIDSKLWLIDFSEGINNLKYYPNYSTLLKRFRNNNNFIEAYSVYETAIKFQESGFELEFDPIVKVEGVDKKPDLKFINPKTNEVIYCEVSISKVSIKERKAQETDLIITNQIIRNQGILFAGYIYKTLSNNHLKLIQEKIQILANKVLSDHKFAELIEEGAIILGLATEKNKDDLIQWAKKHNCQFNSILGPPIDVNEVHRMESKIQQEQKQLPIDYPNLIMIYDQDFKYSIGNKYDAVNTWEELIFDMPNVNCVIIKGYFIGGQEENKMQIRDHYYIEKKDTNANSEQYLLLWNKFCEIKLSQSSIDKIIHSFED